MPMLSSIVFGLAAGASGILASQHLYVDLHAEASHGKPYDQARNYSEPYVPTHLLGGQAASLNFTQVASEPHFQIFDRDLAEAILAPNATITQILKNDDDYWWAHEAPIYFPQTDSLYFVSNAGAPQGHTGINQTNTIFTLDNLTGVALRAKSQGHALQWNDSSAVHVFPVDSPRVQMINGGTAYGRDHMLYVTEGRGQLNPSVVLVHRHNASEPPRVLADNAYGRQWNGLNDVALHPQTGQIFFTDSWYGQTQKFRPPMTMRMMTWCLDPRTGSLRALDDSVAVPNGVHISPDGRKVYITSTATEGPVVDLSATAGVYEFDVRTETESGRETHQLMNKRMFSWAFTKVPDGIKVDRSGNVYADYADGVMVSSAQGIPAVKMFFPSLTNNFVHAGDGRLVVMDETSVYLVDGLTMQASGPDPTALPAGAGVL